jgi:hypothetical protein
MREDRNSLGGAVDVLRYLPDLLTYLVFAIVMAAGLWFVDSTFCQIDEEATAHDPTPASVARADCRCCQDNLTVKACT